MPCGQKRQPPFVTHDSPPGFPRGDAARFCMSAMHRCNRAARFCMNTIRRCNHAPRFCVNTTRRCNHAPRLCVNTTRHCNRAVLFCMNTTWRCNCAARFCIDATRRCNRAFRFCIRATRPCRHATRRRNLALRFCNRASRRCSRAPCGCTPPAGGWNRGLFHRISRATPSYRGEAHRVCQPWWRRGLPGRRSQPTARESRCQGKRNAACFQAAFEGSDCFRTIRPWGRWRWS